MNDWEALRKSLLSDKADSVLPLSVQLPVLPKALMDFRKKAEDPDACPDELSRIITSDAGLSTELLRNVNTAKSGTRKRITSVKQAIVLLGIRQTLLYLTVCGMKQVMKSTASKMINFQTFWNKNLERGILARDVARLLGADPDVAFTAGMLQDFLLPLITNQLYDDYLEFTEHRENYPNLTAFEKQTFGWDHAEAAAHVMYSWNFPDELVCAVFFHHSGVGILKNKQAANTAVAASAIAALMPDAIGQIPNGMQQLIQLEQAWPAFNLKETAKLVDEEFEEVSNNARNRFSFLRAYRKAACQAGIV